MNDVLRYVISEFLDFNDLLNLCLTCKDLHKILKVILLKKKIKKQKQIEQLFNFNIIDIVNKQNFLNAKCIEWNEKWSEEYVNQIKCGEIKCENFTHCINYTKDKYKRSFLFVKVKVKNPTLGILPKVNWTIMIIFQKYSDISVYFVTDYNNYCITDKNKGIYIEIEYYKHFKNFFKTGKFNYKDFPYEFPFPPLYEKVEMIF